MGIVIRQSIQNTVITYVGFAIGAANTLFLYPHFLGKQLYGLTGYVLATANVIMPVMAFGAHNTMVRYFRHYETEQEKNGFLSFLLLLPLLFLVPAGLVLYAFYDQIAGYFAERNPLIFSYFWQIPLIALCMGYFEIYYAWAKVHLQSIFGNFVREVLLRVLISLALTGIFLGWYGGAFFVNLTLAVYLAATLAMMVYAFRIRPMRWDWKFPANHREVLRYSVFIILSGGIANALLDLDKNMLGHYIAVENIAYYSVAGFIATVISVPSRSMHQITYPLTARLMSEGKMAELNQLYQKSSITLQVGGGLFYVGILCGIRELYSLMPPEYAAGIFSVFVIGLSKYLDLLLGNNNAIIFNSRYYRTVLLLGVLLVVIMVGLNAWLIPLLQIDGCALATLISVALYSWSKLWFVTRKMNLFPFTMANLWSGLILVATFLLFYYWEFPFHPVLNIGLKAILVTGFYLGAHYLLKVSAEINALMDQAVSLVVRRFSRPG